jgi:hypothetical protein
MGCYLVTEPMNRRHELSMDSYHRLFRNQDTMLRGGFGNLIALPLRYDPRQQGRVMAHSSPRNFATCAAVNSEAFTPNRAVT